MLKNQKMFTWLRFCIAAYVFNKKSFTQHMHLFTFKCVSNWGDEIQVKGEIAWEKPNFYVNQAKQP